MASQNDLKGLSQKIGKLPTLPGVAIKILQAMQRETPNIAEISEVISADAPAERESVEGGQLAFLRPFKQDHIRPSGDGVPGVEYGQEPGPKLFPAKRICVKKKRRI
ncbi:MAG: HDOD domain-containing protein [Desulfobacterales bacterium]|nr:HDOD domain-containing protein [Desulfobacterales bacterium]